MDQIRPSEKFLLAQRVFTFLDEWLFYALLWALWRDPKIPLYLFGLVAIIGTTMIIVSYIKQWYMEARRFDGPVPFSELSDCSTKLTNDAEVK